MINFSAYATLRTMDSKELNFGQRVEQLLIQRNIKPSDFYSSTNLVPQAFYDWKKKDQVPNARTALTVAKFFGVTVEYLITGETKNPLQPKVEELQQRLKKMRELINELSKDC